MKKTDVIGKFGRPVGYYPSLVPIVGDTKTCLFLCQLIYWSDRGKRENEIYKTAQAWKRETGLSENEQRTARKKLKKLDIISERRARLEHRIYYTVNFDVLDVLVDEERLKNF